MGGWADEDEREEGDALGLGTGTERAFFDEKRYLRGIAVGFLFVFSKAFVLMFFRLCVGKGLVFLLTTPELTKVLIFALLFTKFHF